MPVKNPRKLFVNLPVEDLQRSMTFFEGDTRTHNEGLFAIGVDKHASDPVDLGFMYGWSFLDPDGHPPPRDRRTSFSPR